MTDMIPAADVLTVAFNRAAKACNTLKSDQGAHHPAVAELEFALELMALAVKPRGNVGRPVRLEDFVVKAPHDIIGKGIGL